MCVYMYIYIYKKYNNNNKKKNFENTLKILLIFLHIFIKVV